MCSSSKSFLAGLVSLLLVCLLIFFGLEIFLRTTHAFGARISWSVPDPELGWRFAPNGHFWSQEENDHPVRWSTNRYGWKDKNWESGKKAGYRIAVLGDSYAEALQVEPEKNSISLAEKILKDSGVSTEWMNFGRAGFTQTEEYLILEKDVLPFQPDLLVLFFFPINDIEDIAPETTTDPVRPYYKLTQDGSLLLDTSFNQGRSYGLKSFLSGLKQKSAFISLITQRFSLLLRRGLVKRLQTERKQRAVTLQSYLSLATPHPDPVFARNYALNKLLIGKIADAAHEHGADLLLVLIDSPTYRPEVEAEYKQKDPGFDPLFFDKDLSQFSQARGIKFLNLQPAFREAYAKNGHLLHWDYWRKQVRADSWEYGAHTGHWNYEGHELAGKTLAEAFTAWQKARKV